MTVTVDNASSNDVACGYLRRKLSQRKSCVSDEKYLHMRCIAYIVNVMVWDGLKEVGQSVQRVRDAVRYVRQSPARLQRFRECVEKEKIESNAMLSLDVSTRWNSTYLMLNIAQKFERAFEKFADEDPFFRLEIGFDPGMPVEEDWNVVRRLVTFLELMAERMKAKFDKYWGNIDKMNKLIYITVFLDPRCKMVSLALALQGIYGEEKANDSMHLIKEATFSLFEEYEKMYAPATGQCSGSGGSGVVASNSLSHEENEFDLERMVSQQLK
uniref:Zinc finger BED domain-containing protein RICESLEEPER 2-like n=1 Tax=Elaeis guineensis var. tenera TaxID=51953 RepID=A0A6I9QG19_ELAGV|nr:zinc finger BED domain-containing protein RICESLEEPER 2-like [Elaeis guineensis]